MLALIIDTIDALKDGYQRWRDGPPSPRRPSPPSMPTPSPLAPAVPEASASLPAVKRWSHPFGDQANPLLQLTQLAKAAAGYYPLGRNGMWHGGVHFDAGTAGVVDQSHVRCVADGEVVAYRIPEHTPHTLYYPGPGLTVQAPCASGFVLVRHRLEAPPLKGCADTPPSLTFFSLYMHLQDWASYQADTTLERPAFWPEGSTLHVRMTANDPSPGDPTQRGLNVRHQAHQGTVLGFLPRGAAVTLSGEGSYRKLEGTRGPQALQNPDGTLKGYVAFHLLQEIGDGVYRVATEHDPLTVHATPHRQGKGVGRLPKGSEVTVSGEGEFRKLESVAQYVHFASLESERQPSAGDRVVVLDTPHPIQAGDLIGHLGPYQDGDEALPQKKLHLEAFTADDVKGFLTASRAWAARLPDQDKTWLKLVAGTPVVSHQPRYGATQPPMPFDANTPSGTDLLLPKPLLEGLPAERKIQLPAADGRKALNWYRLDGLLNDSAGNLLDGWVREEVGVTPWVNPWAWEGYGLLVNNDPPENGLAYLMDRLGLSSEEDRARNRPRADASDQGPLKTRLYAILDKDRNGKITADEMAAAISTPAYAQSIAQLIIHYESEWYYRDSKWDALDDVLGHTTSAPLLNWSAEKERIKQLAWWEEVAARGILPENGKVYHLQPIGLVGQFYTLLPQARRVLRGQITFDAEGNDNSSTIYFSRVIHWPGNELSGVTLGRGYDMGSRSQDDIYNDLVASGIPNDRASRLSMANGLKGDSASRFVAENKIGIGEITHDQQVALFNLVYPEYVERAAVNYKNWTLDQPGRYAWEELDPIIRDILVDFVYQGFTKGPMPMRAGMNNDRDELIRYIETTAAINQYEPGRRRASYLREN